MRMKMHEQEMNELIARLDWLVKQQAHLILMENFSQNEKMYCKEFTLHHSKHSIVVLYHFYEDIQIDHADLYLQTQQKICFQLVEVLHFIQERGAYSFAQMADLFQVNYPKYMRRYRQQKKSNSAQ